MKAFMIFAVLLSLTANSFATVIRSKDQFRDEREIRIQKKADGKTYFAFCKDSTTTKCKLIGKKGFTDAELMKKFKSERVTMYAKSAGVAVVAVVGVFLALDAIAAGPLVYISGALTTGGKVAVGSAAAFFGSLAYKVEDIFGRSPVEGYRATKFLKRGAQGGVMVTGNLDETLDLYVDVLTEI